GLGSAYAYGCIRALALSSEMAVVGLSTRRDSFIRFPPLAVFIKTNGTFREAQLLEPPVLEGAEWDWDHHLNVQLTASSLLVAGSEGIVVYRASCGEWTEAQEIAVPSCNGGGMDLHVAGDIALAACISSSTSTGTTVLFRDNGSNWEEVQT